MDSKELINKVKLYCKVKKELKSIDLLPEPVSVQKKPAYKLAEWYKYLIKKQEQDSIMHNKTVRKSELEREESLLKNYLIKMLPDSNTWFVTDNNEYAVGHRSNNWPGDNGELLLIEKPVIKDLKEIKHQIIN